MWQTGCLLLISLCIAGSFGAVRISPSMGTVTVAEGKSLQLNCTGEPNSVLTWKFGNTVLGTGGDLEIRGGVVAPNVDNVSILTHNNVGTDRSGEYRCIDNKTAAEATVIVRILKVATTDALFKYQEGATIACSADPDDAGDKVTYTWMKNGTNVSDIPTPSGQKFVEHENGTLEFRPVTTTREDAGVYECKMTVGTSEFSSTATLYAKPFVIPFDKSKNLVQEERLDVRCKVLGYPTPSITWFKDDVEIQADDEGSRYKLAEDNGHPNAQLKIDSVDFDDAGNYKCVASAEHIMFDEPDMSMPVPANASETILVRVKDKLAALWPFLGIVAEVVILCTIIFIYEKKRNKDAANEDAVNQDGATPEKSKEGVRHRGNTNNPRA